MSTFDSQVSKKEIIETQIEHTRLSFLDRQSSDQNFSSQGNDQQSSEHGGTFTKLFMHVSSRNMFPTTRNMQIRVHVFRPRHYCGD
jgi:hypothetical protein